MDCFEGRGGEVGRGGEERGGYVALTNSLDDTDRLNRATDKAGSRGALYFID